MNTGGLHARHVNHENGYKENSNEQNTAEKCIAQAGMQPNQTDLI